MIRNAEQAISLRNMLRMQIRREAEDYIKTSKDIEASELNAILTCIDQQINTNPRLSEYMFTTHTVVGISHSTICNKLEDLGFTVDVVHGIGDTMTITVKW